MLPPGDPGRKVLVIDGQTSTLTQLPAPDPKEHRLTLRGEVDDTGATEAMPVTLKATAAGYPDYELRTTARAAKEHGSHSRCLRPIPSRRRLVCLGGAKGERGVRAGRGFVWKAEGTWVGGCSASGSLRSLRAPFWLPKDWELALHRRKAGLHLNQGYPLTLDEEFVFALPAKHNPWPCLGVSENKTEPLRWRMEWTKIGDDKWAARLRVELGRGEFSAQKPGLAATTARAAGGAGRERRFLGAAIAGLEIRLTND